MKTLPQFFSLVALFLALHPVSAAEFAPVFTSHAVLQRGQPVTVWGTGRDGESVTIEILGKSVTTEVKNGHWKVEIPPLPASASTTLRLRSDREVMLEDIAVGEVWICGGQSNMEWRLNQCAPHTDELLATANNPLIRQIKLPLRAYAGDPLANMEWKPFDKASAPFFSAVAYYFAYELQKKLDVPIGIVNCGFGGTPIEAWMSREAITSAGQEALLTEDTKKAAAYASREAYEEAWQNYVTTKKTWEERKKAGATPEELGPQPNEPYGLRTKSRPGTLRESMLALVTPYTACGMLWYQGENNAGHPEPYASLLKEFMTSCRTDWSRPDWPFFIGQLSSPTVNWPDHEDPYARLRDAQRAVASADPHSGLVVTLDHGERGNVHPIQKQPVGERFARLALARAYSQTGFAAQSPVAQSVTREGESLVVRFVELPGTLVVSDPALPTLEAQAADGSWMPAAGEIAPNGRDLRITPPAGSHPVKAVRYAWRNFCPLTLSTDEGLPVSPWLLPVTP